LEGNLWAWGPNNYNQTGLPNSKKDVAVVTPRVVHALSPPFLGTAAAAALGAKGRSIVRSKIIEVAPAMHHAVALTDGGDVVSVGRGPEGRLGHGDGEAQEAFKRVYVLAPNDGAAHNAASMRAAGDKIVHNAGGDAHSLAGSAHRAGYAWGYGDLLQLGNGVEDDVFTPVRVEGKQLTLLQRRPLLVAGGSQHSLVVASSQPGSV
jgi:regulator of chromosome condensation